MKAVSLSIILFTTFSVSMFADSIYNASLNTLPQAQQFTYSGDNGNATPTVSGGVLTQVKTVPNTSQIWTVNDSSIDFAHSFTLEANVNVLSSNYVSNVGDGSSREGYYLAAFDSTGAAYLVGLTSTGVVLNDYPHGVIQPFNTSGFHLYDLNVNNDLANLYIDGILFASGITPESASLSSTTGLASFGAGAGASISSTELSFYCTSDSGAACAPAAVATPERSTSLLLVFGVLVSAGYARLKAARLVL